MSFVHDYTGSSFVGLLKASHPELVPRWETSGKQLELVHGTTIVAIEYQDGVLLGSDRRATMANLIMHDEVTKVFQVDEHSAMAIAGTFGPSVKMARLFQVELEHYEKIEGGPLSLDGRANKLSQMIEMNFPAAIQGLMVMPLYVGYDTLEDCGKIYEYDITGGMFTKTTEEPFSCSGSGGDRAHATFEHFWREGMSREEGTELVVKALKFASKRDTATGPKGQLVLAVNKDGCEFVRDGSERDDSQ